MSEFKMPELHRPLANLVTQVDAKITSRKDQSKPYVGLEHIPSNGAYLSGWGKADSSISTNSIFSKDDVLFGKLRPNLRKCIAAPFDGYCSTDILVLRANDGIVPGFAVRVFQTEAVGAAAERTSIGTKMPRTSWGHLGSEVVFCPDGNEQAKIAQVLDTLDTAIHQTEAIVEKLKQVKQGLLHDLLTRGVDANGELRPSYEEAPELYQESPLGWIPKEWNVQALGNALLGIDAGWSPSCPEEPPREGEWGVLKVSAVSGGVFLPLESKRLPSGLRPVPSIEVNPGDVILARANGVADLVATTVYIEATPKGLMLSDKTLRLNPNPAKLIGRYLAALMRHSAIRKQIGGMLNGSSGQKNISQSQIEALVVSIPSVSEQEVSASLICEAERRIRSEEIELNKLRATKSGLLDDLLTGRVRITPLLAQ